MRPLLTFLLTLTTTLAEPNLAEYQKTVIQEEWEQIFTTKSRTPIQISRTSPQWTEIIASFKPHFKANTPPGSQLSGSLTAFKNWALFSGDTTDPNDTPITPPDGFSSDTTILFLKTRDGWQVVDYGLGHSDAFYIIWTAQYGMPIELLTQKPAPPEDN